MTPLVLQKIILLNLEDISIHSITSDGHHVFFPKQLCFMLHNLCKYIISSFYQFCISKEIVLHPELFMFCIQVCITLNTKVKNVFFLFLKTFDDRLVYSYFYSQFSLSDNKLFISVFVVSVLKFFVAEAFLQQ